MKSLRLARLLLILVTSAASAVAQNHIAADPQPQNPNIPSQRANDMQADYPGQTQEISSLRIFAFTTAKRCRRCDYTISHSARRTAISLVKSTMQCCSCIERGMTQAGFSGLRSPKICSRPSSRLT